GIKMIFAESNKVKEMSRKLETFMEENIYPNEKVYEEQLEKQNNRWEDVPPIIEELKKKAKKEGLWNLFLPDEEYVSGLKNLKYAQLCKIMERSTIAHDTFNFNASYTGNME